MIEAENKKSLTDTEDNEIEKNFISKLNML